MAEDRGTQKPSRDSISLSCDEFIVGLGPFDAPHEITGLSESLGQIASRYRELVTEARLLAEETGVEHDLRHDAEENLAFITRDFTRIPSDIDNLFLEVSDKNRQLS